MIRKAVSHYWIIEKIGQEGMGERSSLPKISADRDTEGRHAALHESPPVGHHCGVGEHGPRQSEQTAGVHVFSRSAVRRITSQIGLRERQDNSTVQNRPVSRQNTPYYADPEEARGREVCRPSFWHN